jgi:hypothetical protein
MQDFKRLAKDICNFPSFFHGSLYKRVLYHYHTRNVKDTSQLNKIWDEIHSNVSPLLGKDLNGQPPGDVNKWGKLVVTFDMIHYFWIQEMEDYDIFDRFFRLIKKPKVDFICKEDFMPFLRELLQSHPVRSHSHTLVRPFFSVDSVSLTRHFLLIGLCVGRDWSFYPVMPNFKKSMPLRSSPESFTRSIDATRVKSPHDKYDGPI